MIWYALYDIICFTEDDGGGRLTESVEGDSKMKREKRFTKNVEREGGLTGSRKGNLQKAG